MKARVFTLLTLIVVITLLVPDRARSTTAQTQPAAPIVSAPGTVEGEAAQQAYDRGQMVTALESAPLMFVENVGQFDAGARFQVRGSNTTIYLTNDAFWFTVLEQPTSPQSQSPDLGEDALLAIIEPARAVKGRDQPRRGVNLRFSFEGANPNPLLEPFNRLGTHVSYFIGHDSTKWQPDVPVWGSVRYVDLYPGVDLEVSSERGHWMWRLVLRDSRRGSQLANVHLQVEGADSLVLDSDCLRLRTAAGGITLPLLAVEGAMPDGQPTTFNVEPGVFEVSFPFSPSPIPLTSLYPQDNLDGLLYSTFLGGSGDDRGNAIAVDGAGGAYVTGFTNSPGFPTTPGAFDTSLEGSSDVFVVKVNAGGTGLTYSTFLGGSFSEEGFGIAVDGTGSAYVTGYTVSADFPTTFGAFDTTHNGDRDAFVVKVSSDGTRLAYATFLGGDAIDYGRAVSVDQAGSAYLTGETGSFDFPATMGAFDITQNGNYDAFVVKMNALGTGLTYATFLGAGASDFGYGIAVDEVGSAYVAGGTYSTNFPTTLGAFDTIHNGHADAFVAKLNADGEVLVYGTYLGGKSIDSGKAVAVDGVGNAYVVGHTSSADFPTTVGALDTSLGVSDAFVVKVSADGTKLAYATFLGGARGEQGSAIAVDRVGSAYVTGFTASSDFSTTAEAFDTSCGTDGACDNSCDAFVVKVNIEGTGLTYATFIGGSDGDYGQAIAVDRTGSVYVTGYTWSPDFPTTAGAFDTTYDSSRDIYSAKLAVGGGLTQDLRVDHIQVAQVLLTDTVPLIADKLTLVRVFVGVSGADSIAGVTARLYVKDAQDRIHVVDRTYYNYWPIIARLVPDPYDLKDTVNFLPQVSWLTGTVRFWAEVDPNNRVAESSEDNNIGEIITKTFQLGQRLRIAWVPMLYAPPGPIPSRIYPDERVANKGTLFMERAFPVGINDVEYFRQPTHRTVVMTQPFSSDNALNYYLPALDKFWGLTTRRNGWQGGQPPDRLFGWVPIEAVPEESRVCGMAAARFANLSGRVAAGVAMDYCAYDRQRPIELTFAHELGHLLNTQELLHAPNRSPTIDPNCYGVPSDNRDYPQYDPSYPRGTIGVWGANLYADTLLSPENTYDFMSYCSPQWVSPYHYNKVAGGFVPMTVQRTTATSGLQPQLLVSGIVYTPALTVTFGTFYPITSTVPPDDNSGTDYCLELRSATEAVLDKRCFDLGFTNPETGRPVSAAAFTFVLPYPYETHSVVLTHLGTELGRITASDHAPTVHLISPSGGESWGASDTYTVAWVANDLDGDPLSFIVSYSPDGGNAWMPLALDVTTPYLAVYSRNLPGSTSALIRVDASDQMHAAEDISDAPLTVERKGPQAYIFLPERDVTIVPGTLLLLQGYGYDLEDGALGGNDLSWTSSRDGDLGTGSLALVTLSTGQHVVTLRAMDSDSNVATASVNVYAGFMVFLPTMLKNR